MPPDAFGIESHRVEVDLEVATAQHRPGRTVVLGHRGTHSGSSGGDLIKSNHEIEVAMRPMLITEKSVYTPTAIEPDRYSCLLELPQQAQHICGVHVPMMTDDYRTLLNIRAITRRQIRAGCHRRRASHLLGHGRRRAIQLRQVPRSITCSEVR